MICYKGIIVCLLQISIINRPSKGYVMHFCQGMYVYMPKKKRRRVLLHLMPMNSKCIAPAITHSQRTDLIAVVGNRTKGGLDTLGEGQAKIANSATSYCSVLVLPYRNLYFIPFMVWHPLFAPLFLFSRNISRIVQMKQPNISIFSQF